MNLINLMRNATHARLLAVFMCMYIGVYAQTTVSYNFPKDDSLLKQRFFDLTMVKRDAVEASINKEFKTDYKKIYDEQYRSIGEFWKSSRPVTSKKGQTYLNTLVEKIKSSNPELSANDARVVFSRDWWPNASSMGDGTIAINAGLMVCLDNEAELAFVVSHELAHYYLDHTTQKIINYVTKINDPAYKAEVKRISKQEFKVNSQFDALQKKLTFDSRSHGREHESDADRLAFHFFTKAGFDAAASGSLLNLLDKVDDSLWNQPVQIEKEFDFAQYPFRKSWIEKETSIFSSMKDESALTQKELDSLKTHPDCAKRVLMLNDSINAYKGKGALYQVDQNIFLQLKDELFLEMMTECKKKDNLSRYLYYNLMLLHYPSHAALASKNIVSCLNEIYQRQQTHHLDNAFDSESKAYPEEYNLLLRMLYRLRLDEIAKINYSFCKKQEEIAKDEPGYYVEMKKAIQLLKN